MYLTDLLYVLKWWLMFFIIGLAFLPMSIRLMHNFFDKGYAFSKVFGILIIGYIVFLLGTLHLATFTQLETTIITIGTSITMLLIFTMANNKGLLKILRESWKIFILEEFAFLSALIFWSYIRAHQPDIHGLEKFMDFGFINSILRSSYFPPKDMWFTPYSINYYYFGHLVTAVLTRLSGLPSYITFNLMLATIFAFTFTLSFSIGTSLFAPLAKGILKPRRIVITGIFVGILSTFGGNLHAIYAFFLPYTPSSPVPFWQLKFSPATFPNSYWYPNATRFIYNTIHEFPLYSFVVSDLHGHVLSIPIVLTIIALLLNWFLSKKNVSYSTIAMVIFLLSTAYMTNALDGFIYFLLTAFVLIYKTHNKQTPSKIGLILILSLIGFIILTLPFSLHFKPFVSNIGILCAPKFLTDIGKVGPFIFEPNHCQKSPLWQLGILYGFFYFWLLVFIIYLRRIKQIQNTDKFVLLLTALSTLLIIIPEFAYLKDIYPAHYRANTMFKLVYQSFIMLSLCSGYIIIRMLSALKKNMTYLPLMLVGSIGLALVMMYPYFAINSYYGNLQKYYGLDGTTYLQTLYPSDYQMISWINKNIQGQPVILEAQGDSYTDYARISANTGLPTVLGWTVHEWLWRGSYDIPAPRIADVQKIYESPNFDEIKSLIKKYNIKYIYVDYLEMQKYPLLDPEKFQKLGEKIFYYKDLESNQDLSIFKLK